MSTHLATRSGDFNQSVGINTHISSTSTSYGNLQSVVSQLDYLGVYKVRDVIPGAALASYKALAAEGIRFSLEYPTLALTHADLVTQMHVLDALGTGVLQVEGPNEPNVVAVSYNGIKGPAGAVALQQALYSAVHNDRVLNNATQKTPVLAFGLAPSANYSLYGNVSAYSDFTNAHVYSEAGAPPYWSMAIEINAITTTPGKPLQITETGQYALFDHRNGVSESVQAKWDVDRLLQAYQLGSSGTFLFQLQDIQADPLGTSNEFHFGLFNADGTPKLAALAVHALTTILADTAPQAASFTPGSLSYALTGLPYYGLQNLTQKADGTFDLALWAEPAIWNSSTDTDIYVAPSKVSVAFAQTYATINVYNVMVGTTPVATYHNVSQISLSLSSDPLIVEILPALPVGPQTIALAAGATTVTGHVVAQAGSDSTTVTVNDAETVLGGAGSLAVKLGGQGASVAGGSGALSVVDTTGGNSVTGGTGSFTLSVAAGTEVITTGSSASNRVTLGSGKASVTTLGATTVIGGNGVANVTLTGGGNLVAGRAGVLMISDLAGGNTISGGSGAFGLTALVGNDAITTGTSTVNTVALGAGVSSVKAVGQSTVFGGSGTATVTLAKAGSLVVGGSGTMNVTDSTGGNTLMSGTGVFNLTALVGNDTITTQALGRSRITLGGGNDTIIAGGATTVFGGAGTAVATLNSAGSSITGGAGALTVTDTLGGNTIKGGAGSLTVTALASGDLITVANTASIVLGTGAPNSAGSTVTGGTGALSVTDNGTARNTITGGTGVLSVNALLGGDTITTNNTSGVSSISLGTGSDTVVANGATSISAGKSNLAVISNGNLSINGGSGALTLTGISGSAYVFTQGGTKNLLNLGSGANTVLSHGADTINASTVAGAASTGVFAASSATITGGAGTLVVNGQAAAITVTGGTGAVKASSMANGSLLKGGSLGGNILSASGGNTTLMGGGGGLLSDTGTAGGNLLMAGSGATTLTAGSGNDTLVGGSGADVFVLTRAAAAHGAVIQNYTAGSDTLSFVGFGSTPAIASQQVSGGNLNLTLADQTHVTLVGVTSPV